MATAPASESEKSETESATASASATASVTAGAGRLAASPGRISSADEVLAALRVAEAWGELGAEETKRPMELLDRLLAVLWRLTH